MQIPPEDIRWDGEENGVTLNVGHGGGTTRGSRRTSSHGGRGRGPRAQPRREHLATENGGGRKFSDEIELFNTDSLVKEVGIYISALCFYLGKRVFDLEIFPIRSREFLILTFLIHMSLIRPRNYSR